MQIGPVKNVAVVNSSIPQIALENELLHMQGVTVQHNPEPAIEPLKLTLKNAECEAKQETETFGTHIKEAIAIVKDWTRKP